MNDECELVQFHDGNEWRDSLYCPECVKIIQQNAWKTTKDNLMGVDCLAAFRNIQTHGLSTTLVEHDMLGNKSYTPVSEIRYKVEPETTYVHASGKLDIDLTQEQCDNLVAEIRALDIKDVSSEDIKVITGRYW